MMSAFIFTFDNIDDTKRSVTKIINFLQLFIYWCIYPLLLRFKYAILSLKYDVTIKNFLPRLIRKYAQNSDTRLARSTSLRSFEVIVLSARQVTVLFVDNSFLSTPPHPLPPDSLARSVQKGRFTSLYLVLGNYPGQHPRRLRLF